MATLEQLIQARNSLRTALEGVFPQVRQIEAQIKAGATLDEVQGQLDLVRSEFDKIYAQVESIRTQAEALEPRPDAFLAELATSLDVNRPTNYQVLGRLTTMAGQNTNQRNADTASKAAADQGPRTDSAGAEVTAEGTATQAPAAPGQQQSANGDVTTASTTSQPSNAEKFAAPDSTAVQPSAAALPGPQSATASGAVPPATGTTVPTAATANAIAAPGQSEAALSYIYKAVTVTSTFERGRFTQDLEGVLLIFPNPPRKTVYRDSDDNLAYEYNADDNLAFEGRPGGTGPTTPPVLSGPVLRQPNAENLAQAAESTTGESAPVNEATDTIAPAITTPADSGGSIVAAPTANQPPPVSSTRGYITQVPAGVTQDTNSGAWQYQDDAGSDVSFVAGTNEALAGVISAVNSGTTVNYVDFDRNSGWVNASYNGVSRTRTVIGPAADPYSQSAGTAAPTQNMARES